MHTLSGPETPLHPILSFWCKQGHSCACPAVLHAQHSQMVTAGGSSTEDRRALLQHGRPLAATHFTVQPFPQCDVPPTTPKVKPFLLQWSLSIVVTVQSSHLLKQPPSLSPNSTKSLQSTSIMQPPLCTTSLYHLPVMANYDWLTSGYLRLVLHFTFSC